VVLSGAIGFTVVCAFLKLISPPTAKIAAIAINTAIKTARAAGFNPIVGPNRENPHIARPNSAVTKGGGTLSSSVFMYLLPNAGVGRTISYSILALLLIILFPMLSNWKVEPLDSLVAVSDGISVKNDPRKTLKAQVSISNSRS